MSDINVHKTTLPIQENSPDSQDAPAQAPAVDSNSIWDHIIHGAAAAGNAALFNLPEIIPGVKGYMDKIKETDPIAEGIGGTAGAIGSMFIPVGGIVGNALRGVEGVGAIAKGAQALNEGEKALTLGQKIGLLAQTVPGQAGQLGSMMKLGALEGGIGSGVSAVAQDIGNLEQGNKSELGNIPGNIAMGSLLGAVGGSGAHVIGSLGRSLKGLSNDSNVALLKNYGLNQNQIRGVVGEAGSDLYKAKNADQKIEDVANQIRAMSPSEKDMNNIYDTAKQQFSKVDEALVNPNGIGLKTDFLKSMDPDLESNATQFEKLYDGTDLGTRSVFKGGFGSDDLKSAVDAFSQNPNEALNLAQAILSKPDQTNEYLSHIAQNIINKSKLGLSGDALVNSAKRQTFSELAQAGSEFIKTVPNNPSDIYNQTAEKILGSQDIVTARQMADDLYSKNFNGNTNTARVVADAAKNVGDILDGNIKKISPEFEQALNLWKIGNLLAKGELRDITAAGNVGMGSDTALKQMLTGAAAGAGATGGPISAVLASLIANPLIKQSGRAAQGVMGAMGPGIKDFGNTIGPLAKGITNIPIGQTDNLSGLIPGRLGGQIQQAMNQSDQDGKMPTNMANMADVAPGSLAVTHNQAMKGDPQAQTEFMQHIEDGIKAHWMMKTMGLGLFGPADMSNPRFAAFHNGAMQALDARPAIINGKQVLDFDPARAGQILFLNPEDAQRYTQTAQGLRTMQQSAQGIQTGPVGAVSRIFNPEQQAQLEALKEGFNRMMPAGASRSDTDKVVDAAFSPMSGGRPLDVLYKYLNLANPSNMHLLQGVTQ